MQPNALKLSELRVESFETESLPRNAATPHELLNTRTRWPKDCPETLPQFC
jgi:hypothetical protein